jgi:phosphinothricin acetyltransferase
MSVDVREAVEADLEPINNLYNHYVRNFHYTFDVEPWTLEMRREWFGHYAKSGPHRLVIAADGDDVAGFAASHMFRPKIGYNTSIETTIYLGDNHTGQGVGTKLYKHLFKLVESEDLHRAYAGIAMPNPASVALHEKLGFKRVAYFSEQGRKFDKYWDVAWYEKPLNQ